MTVYSDMPGVQLYTFNGTSGLKNKDGSDMIPTGHCALRHSSTRIPCITRTSRSAMSRRRNRSSPKSIYKFTVK